MPPLPLTPEACLRQAESLRLYERLPPGEARLVWHTVANPAARIDTMLVLAEALRQAAAPLWRGGGRLEVATDIEALAPTRAVPAPQEPPCTIPFSP